METDRHGPFFSYLITRCGPYLEPRSDCLSISFWCCRQIRPVASAAAAWTLTSPTVHSVEENCLLSTFAGQSLSVLTRPIPRILLYGIISLEKINMNQEDALRKHHARYTAVLEIILAAKKWDINVTTLYFEMGCEPCDQVRPSRATVQPIGNLSPTVADFRIQLRHTMERRLFSLRRARARAQ